MAENVLKIRVEGELAYIALNRPEKRNAINQAMLRAIPEALDELDRPDVRAIIIYGEGQAFSAGIGFSSLTNDTGGPGAPGRGRDIQRFPGFVAVSPGSLTWVESISERGFASLSWSV